MMIKYSLLLFLFCISFSELFGQNGSKNIYSGGMLILQPGYTITETDYQKISDLGFGLGGILRFYVFKNFTIGIYGGTQKTKYSTSGSEFSYLNIGFGGPFVGVTKRSEKFRGTMSVFAGKATIRNLHVDNQIGPKLVDAYFYKYSSFAFAPIVSLDYFITHRLMLTLQSTYLMANYDSNKFFSNASIQLGILFNR